MRIPKRRAFIILVSMAMATVKAMGRFEIITVQRNLSRSMSVLGTIKSGLDVVLENYERKSLKGD